MKKVNKKPTKYTVSKFCSKCGKKTVHSLYDRETLQYRCNVCGQIVKPFGERKVKVKVVEK